MSLLGYNDEEDSTAINKRRCEMKQDNDPVLAAIDAAKWDEIESPETDEHPMFAHAINGANVHIEAIRTAYLDSRKPNDDCPCCSGRGTNDDGYGNEGACMTCDGTGKVDPVLAAIAVEEGERCGYVSLYKVRHAYLATFTDDWRRFMMRHQKKYLVDLFETQSRQHDADRAADKQRIAELEAQVASAYKQGYDDGHSKGFTEGYTEKEQELK